MKIIAIILAFAAGTACAAPPQKLTVPAGFTIERLNFDVPNARQMALTEQGTLIVGSRRAGNVYAVPQALTAAAPEVITLMSDLKMPSGVTVHQGDLFIGAVSKILKVPSIDQNLKTNPSFEVITDQLPTETHHGWKYLKFGPDQQLYVPVGAPCNICLSEDKRFASLLQMNPANGETTVWAHGIRNTVGFAWHPQDGSLWITDNGRDMMGDDIPAEEVNISTRPGQHFGYPFVHAGDVKDPEFGDHPAGAGLVFEPPALKIQAHSAALGVDFYTGTQFPPHYKNALFIAERGSWNRSSKVGYQVSVALSDADGKLNYEPFVTGWLVGEEDWGRPNDVLVTPDGSLLIADDKQGAIYRVRYTKALASR